MPMEWVPDLGAPSPLNRYFNGNVHEVTTGWVSPDGSFQLQQLLGHLYINPLQGATVPFYGCKRGQTDYFISLDISCEGQRILGKQGYGYSETVPASTWSRYIAAVPDTIISLAKIPNAKARPRTNLGYVAP